MQKTTGTRRAATVRERYAPCSLTVAVLLCPVALCIAVGCEGGFGSKQLNDPMFGTSTPKPLTTPSTPSSTATAQATSGPLPPMPSSYTSAGTAPVASGETATPENPRLLRMAADPAVPTAVPTAGAARGVAPGVTVGNPELAPAASTANFTKAPPSPPPTGPGSNIRTYEEAQQFLTQQRVSWQRLDMEDGQWKFECGVPNPSNPRMNRHYVTSKAFPDPLSAIREVISQIEKNGP